MILGFFIGSFVVGVVLTIRNHYELRIARRDAFEAGAYSIASLSAATHRAQQEYGAMRETSALSNLN